MPKKDLAEKEEMMPNAKERFPDPSKRYGYQKNVHCRENTQWREEGKGEGEREETYVIKG